MLENDKEFNTTVTLLEILNVGMLRSKQRKRNLYLFKDKLFRWIE